MGDLVTVDEANALLRLDLETDEGSPPAFIDPDLPRIEMLITQAEGIILNYLKIAREDAFGSPSPWSQDDFRNVQAAVCCVLQVLYDDEPDKVGVLMTPPNGTVPSLLARLRDPALA